MHCKVIFKIAHLYIQILCDIMFAGVESMKKLRNSIFVRIICWILYIVWTLLRPLIFIVSHIVTYLWGGVFTLTLFVVGLMCLIDGFKETMRTLWLPLLILYSMLIVLSLITLLSQYDPSFLIRKKEEEIQLEQIPVKRVIKASERQDVHYDHAKGDVTYSVERTAVGIEFDQEGETVIIQEYPVNQKEIE